MITINKPFVCRSEADPLRFRLQSKVFDESRDTEFDLYFETDEEYADYLNDESADAFLISILASAVYSGQSIKVLCPVSRRLLFAVENVHIPFYSKFFRKPEISVEVESTTDISFSGGGVGAGCSLGVDSLSSILKFRK